MTANTAIPGAELVLSPHDLSVSGGSVARFEGMAVFLDKGLPGETLRARITERKARFAKAEALETLTPSPHERPSFCAFGGVCGGCAWTTLAYDAQLAWKEKQVMETLRRIGKVSFAEGAGYLPIIPSPRELGYRNKMEFAFGFTDGAPALGLRQRGSHEIVSISECPLCASPAGPLLAFVREWMEQSASSVWNGAEGLLRHLVLRCPDYAPEGAAQRLVECITSPASGAEKEALAALGAALLENKLATGFVHSERRDKANVAYGEKVITALGETTVTETVGHITLKAPVQAFLQANSAAAAALYEQVRVFAGDCGGAVCDLFCGVGGMALFLAKKGLTVHGVENVPEAVEFARENARAAHIDAGFTCGDAAKTLPTVAPAPDTVITDPPRAGMSSQLVAALLAQKPHRIVAVGCDAASLARDVALLGAAYQVRGARAVDLFPHTPHVEIAVLLERAS